MLQHVGTNHAIERAELTHARGLRNTDVVTVRQRAAPRLVHSMDQVLVAFAASVVQQLLGAGRCHKISNRRHVLQYRQAVKPLWILMHLGVCLFVVHTPSRVPIVPSAPLTRVASVISPPRFSCWRSSCSQPLRSQPRGILELSSNT